MYNEEWKQKFISDYTQSLNTAKVAKVIFEAVEPYEKTYEKDLSALTVDELQPVINNILGLRTGSKWMGITILREYVRWCTINKYPGACDSITKVDLLGLDKVRAQMVASPLHLQRYLDELFDPEEDETIDNIYRCFFWMGYFGIQEEDAVSIKNTDVDLNNMVIHYGDKECTIYREAIPAFRNAVNLTQFRYYHPNYSKVIVRDRVDGTALLRGIKADAHIMTIRPAISKIASAAYKEGKTKNQLSFYRIWLSGLFYRMYEMERAGFPADFSDAAIQQMDGKTYSLSGRATLRQKQNRIAREYMTDYQRWKLAFSI